MSKKALRVGILALLAPSALPLAAGCGRDTGTGGTTGSGATGATASGTGGANGGDDATGGTTTTGSVSTGGTSPAATSGSGPAAAGGTSADPTGGAGGSTSSSDATGGAAGTEAAAGAGGCQHYSAPSEAITDFSSWTTDGNWGTNTTLTGGSFTYPENSSLTLAVDAEVLSVTGTVAATEYAGFGLWFGPCTDASAYSGVTFTIGGDSGQSQVVLQLQTSQNYPIDTENDKGECEGSWSDGCASNQLVLEVPASPGTIEVLWDELSGGVPIEGVDPTELLGIQWQFSCGDADCNVNITVDDVAFITG